MKQSAWWMAALAGLATVSMAAQPRMPKAALQPAIFSAPTPEKTAFQDDLFAGTEKFATGASDVSEVTTEPDGKRKLLSVVRSYTYDQPGMYRIEDVEAYRAKLNTGDWHCSVHSHDLKTGNRPMCAISVARMAFSRLPSSRSNRRS
jgi:hypothetical protein